MLHATVRAVTHVVTVNVCTGCVTHSCACDRQVIPAENLVAAFQAPGAAKLLGTATSAADARVMLEALEVGTAGVVLQTDSTAEVGYQTVAHMHAMLAMVLQHCVTACCPTSRIMAFALLGSNASHTVW